MRPLATGEVVSVEQDGHRTVVDELHLHVGAEDAASHMAQVLLGKLAEVLVEWHGLLGTGGTHKGGLYLLWMESDSSNNAC